MCEYINIMASAGDEDNDAVLSDVEDDDPVPIDFKTTSPENRFREILAELNREKPSRELAEKSKSELQVSFNRLKIIAHEAIKKRDQALRSNENLSSQLSECIRLKNELKKEADALENIIKQSQLQIVELQNTVEELRAEASLMKKHQEAQTKELIQKQQRLEKLEEKERVADENVERLMIDIAAAEEEITRWSMAAQKEADAGKAVELEFVEQLSTTCQELEEAKKAMSESEKKLKYKEETAAAAMAARNAAAESLRLADLRASRLRDKVEELTHQLEELDSQDTLSTGKKTSWQWIGLNFVGFHQSDTRQECSNEMDLSEPLL